MFDTGYTTILGLSRQRYDGCALGGQDSISIGVGPSLSRIGRKTVQVWWLGHALDENEYIHPNMTVSETLVLGLLMQD